MTCPHPFPSQQISGRVHIDRRYLSLSYFEPKHPFSLYRKSRRTVSNWSLCTAFSNVQRQTRFSTPAISSLTSPKSSTPYYFRPHPTRINLFMAEQPHNDASDASRTLSRLTHDTGSIDGQILRDVLTDDHDSHDSSEPTVLDYARFHKLCQHYLYDNPLELASVSTFTDDIDASLCDPPGTEPIAAPPGSFLQEPLLLDRGAADLLKLVKAVEENVIDFDAFLDADYRRVTKLKQEVPILRSDHEQDLREFGNTAKPPLTGLSFPSEELNDEDDEGLRWPSSHIALPSHVDRSIRDEKLEIPREVLLHLQDALQSETTVQERTAILDAYANYEKVGKLSTAIEHRS